MNERIEKMKGKKIQEQEKSNVKNKKKQKLKEKDITLIALVVRIIILLILAGVTLNRALSGDGLFSKARNVADKYKEAQEGYEPTNGNCTIKKEQSGTKEDQEFSTAKEKEDGEDLKWKIWDYDGTTLRIILDRSTTQKLELQGATGYNNGVWAINEVCKKCFGQYEENNYNGTMKI